MGLDGSEAGITYDLFVDGVPTGDSETPIGGAFNFVPQTAPGIYTVTATSIANCGNIMAGNTTISMDPLPIVFNVTGGGNYCEGGGGLPIEVDNSELGIDYQLYRDGVPQGAALSGTGALLDYGLQVFDGSYEVTATNPITFCSQDMLGNPVIIAISAPLVLANNNSPSICSNSPTDIELLSNLTDPTFTWIAVVSSTSVTGAADEASPQPLGTVIDQVLQNTSTFPQTVTYTITATGAGPLFCPGEIKDIEVTVNPTLEAVISGSETICVGTITTLNFDIVGGQVPFDLVYTDGTSNLTLDNIASNHVINVSPAATTTYTIVSVTDAEGCIIETPPGSATITVENPVSEFTPDVNLEGCSALDIVFTNNDILPGIIYEWGWGDGSPTTRSSEEQVMHSFVNNSSSPLSYTVTLTAINEAINCENVSSKVVEVLPSVNIEIAPNVNQGCAPLLVSFSNNSLGVIDNNWYYRVKGTTEENEVTTTRTVTYELPNTTTSEIQYEVVYEAFNGFCLATVITDIAVYPDIEPSFTISENPVEVTTQPHVTVTNTTPNANSWSYLWEWGDGTISNEINPGSHTYANEFGLPISGSFEIRLIASFENENGFCERIVSEIFNVVPVIPSVDFEAGPLEGCRPLTVDFTNLSIGIDATTVLWEFISSNGEVIGTSEAYNPIYTFYDAGRYSVRLTARNSIEIEETEIKESYVDVDDLPTAGFTLRPDVVYLPDGVVFMQNQSSSNADEFFWVFNYLDFQSGGGDESELVSTSYEPDVLYLYEGFKDILLIATDTETGCMDSSLVEKAVFVDEGGVARVPNAFTPSDRGPGAGSGSGGGGSGSDGSFNESFLPYIEGLSRIPGSFHMLIFDRWGRMLFESWDEEVGWDGYDKNGRLLPMGVYVYKLDLFFDDGTSGVRIGDVTLIR